MVPYTLPSSLTKTVAWRWLGVRRKSSQRFGVGLNLKQFYHESNGLLLELLSSGLLADLAGFLPLAQLGLGLGLCFLFVVPTAAWQAHESLELALLVVNFRGFAEVEVLNGGCRLEVVEGNDVLEGGVRFGLGPGASSAGGGGVFGFLTM